VGAAAIDPLPTLLLGASPNFYNPPNHFGRRTMKRMLLLVLLLPLSAHADKYDTLMGTWMAATKAQVTSIWGYPMKGNDVVRLGDVTVYTYEFGVDQFARFGSFGSNGPCRVSFAFKDGRVVHDRWEGTFCPQLIRPH